MKRKYFFWIAALCVALLVSVLPVYSEKIFTSQNQKGFQVSTVDALNVGVFEGALPLSDLKLHGDFGLGTYDGLDGEMVFLDGKFYQVKADGVAYDVADRLKTPFSTVTFFRAERSLSLTGKANYQELQQQINAQLPTLNLPYAIRIQGTFPYLKVRSVPKQSLPYPTLGEVVSKEQRVFELRDVKGTLVGFRLPQYLKGTNVAGYHFHFVTSDRKAGGHLLDGEFLDNVAEIDALQDWEVTLPKHSSFAKAKLEK
ncbi:MAG: acetolactate decarboxylase [Pseudanabaena sp.]|jgi:acetolactate decarboxylase